MVIFFDFLSETISVIDEQGSRAEYKTRAEYILGYPDRQADADSIWPETVIQ